MSVPSADDVALAIVVCAREYGEDPLEVAQGVPDLHSRKAAHNALTMCFPSYPPRAITRLVGGGSTFLANFKRGDTPAIKQNRQRVQRKAFEAVRQQIEAKEPLTLRRAVALDAANVTAGNMGDPSRERSALATAPTWRPYEQIAGRPDGT